MCLMVYCVAGSEEEAVRIARVLVEEKLAACVNRFPCRLLAHVLLGQLLVYNYNIGGGKNKEGEKEQQNIRTIINRLVSDPRLHFFWIGNSGSGKTSHSDTFIQITEGLGLTTKSLDDWSDAALIGTLREEVIKGKRTGEILKVKGNLETYNFIWGDEASSLLEKGSHKEGKS